MMNPDIPYDEVINDLTSINGNLEKSISSKKQEIKKLTITKKKVSVVKDYWEGHPIPDESSGRETLNSAVSVIHDFRSFVDKYNPEEISGDILNAINGSGDSIAIAGATCCFLAPLNEEKNEQIKIKFIKINNEPKRKNKHITIKSSLKDISPHLGKMYAGAWESFDLNDNDPERGAMFLMREVISQIIDFLAPKEIMQKIFNLNPEENATRRQRLEYIAENKAKDVFNSSLIDSMIKSILDSYSDLNKAHKRKALNSSEVENFLFQADDLLHIFLNAIDLKKNNNNS